MTETGTIHDAAVVFSALRGDQVIELLSRLETDDAQRLLATAAKVSATIGDLEHSSALLARELKQPKPQQEERQKKTDSNQIRSSKKKPKRSKQSLKHRHGKKSGHQSLDFLIDMSAQDVRQLLSKVSTACWAPVLKTESHEVQDVVFDNVVPAIERILRKEIDAFDGDPQLTAASRQRIIDAANDLRSTASDSAIRKAG